MAEKDQIRVKDHYTSYISDGIISRRSNLFFGEIVRILFRKTDFDSESLDMLRQYDGKGKIIFVSFQNTTTSLLIFMNLLRRYGLRTPELALGFSPYMSQSVSGVMKALYRFIAVALDLRRYREVSDEEYIRKLVDSGKGIIFSLLSGKLFVRSYVEIKTDILQYLLEFQKKYDEPILVFPQIMFWNTSPERTGAMVSSQATANWGFFTGFFTRLKSSTPSFVRISAPINLMDELAAAPGMDTLHIARSIRSRLLSQYNQEKRTVLGPVIKSRQEMMELVLYHKNVLNEITLLSAIGKGSEQQLRRKAYGYFREIAADFSINYIGLEEKILDYVFEKIFDGVTFNPEDFKMIREASQRGPLVIIPSHKSHMDYVIISTLFFKNRIIPPHILAGANLRFFPMGKIFRRSGAFFMRRSFRGLDLYAVVFKQYIKTLVNEGYTLEFFIEGGRTRTGKILFPKLGMLKYLIEAVDEGYSRDLIFLPATINYDRVLEESYYPSELKGREKKKESAITFVKSRSLLKRNYGKVRLSFNSPVTLSELRGSLEKSENQTMDIAMNIMRRINGITMVTPFSLTTTAILFSSAKGFSRMVLSERVNRLYDYLSFRGVPMTEELMERKHIEKNIDHVLDSYQQDAIVGEINLEGIQTAVREPLEDIFLINEDDRIKIAFYRNTILHYIVPMSFFSLAILCCHEGGPVSSMKAGGEYSVITDLFSREFIYPDIMDDLVSARKILLAYLESRSLVQVKDDEIIISEKGMEEIRFFARLIQDYLESYFVVFDTVIRMERKRIQRKELVSDIRKNGVWHYHLGHVKLTEALSISNYNNALDFLENQGIIEVDSEGKRNMTLRITGRKRAEIHLRNVERYIERLA
jgi:glycerol-3-phosphate O-acyltransferase